MRVWCTARRSNQSILKKINPEYLLEGLMLKLRFPILWPPDLKSRLIGKVLDAGKDWGQEKGTTEDEMVGWHYQHNRCEFDQTLGDSEGQGSLACCSPWSLKESDMIEPLNNNNNQYSCLGELHGQRNLESYSPWNRRVRHDWAAGSFTLTLSCHHYRIAIT